MLIFLAVGEVLFQCLETAKCCLLWVDVCDPENKLTSAIHLPHLEKNLVKYYYLQLRNDELFCFQVCQQTRRDGLERTEVEIH